MGVLHEGDWQARWVGGETNFPTVLLRREFQTTQPVKRAVAHISGLGHYELTVNGRRAGEDLLSPGWTKYDRTCLYDTHDITSLLSEGGNALGVMLGNGMYNVRGGRYVKFQGSFRQPMAIVQVLLEYQDGSSEVIFTDGRWRCASGPITFSCVFGGEDYDARLAPAGWDRPGFDDSRWEKARVLGGPGGKLRGLSRAAAPIRAIERLQPVGSKVLQPGKVMVYDFGQNASLIPRLDVRGPSGAVVRITPAELLAKDGSVDRGSCGGGKSYWQYTLAGGGRESWFPKFFYHGCRYVQVELESPAGEALPVVETLEGVVVHSSSPPVGEFECSNPLFNRIRTLVRWAQRSNMMSVMTDCPHREKLGWLEEDHLNGPSLRYEFDLSRLMTKIMNDVADSQRENGLVPDIAPEYVVFEGGFVDSPEWGSACVLVPWQQYEFHGDTELLRRHYDGMKRYVGYLGSRAREHIVSHGLGDWYDIGPKPPGVAQLTPLALTATAFYYQDAWVVSQAAGLLGKDDDARHFARLAAEIRSAFNREFFDETRGSYATGSQCANAIPLVMNLVEERHRASVLEAIVRDVRARGNALTAGDVGYRYLLRALAEGGRSDVIFDVNNQSEKPGYGYQLKQGATSLTEAWDAGRASSQNHFMLGQIMEWFYRDLAGINSAPEGPGFKKVLIQPAFVGDVTFVKAAYNSIRGPIRSEWRRGGGKIALSVEIPANTSARVSIPARSAADVTESGRPASAGKGIRLVAVERGGAIFEIGSGKYRFESVQPDGAAHQVGK
jgi:hypothetical protein